MLSLMKRLDGAWARFEGLLTVTVLLMMVLTVGLQALVRNLTHFNVPWANSLLSEMDWADSLLRKSTLWLAFLGASLATYHRKHIGIDVLLMIAPTRTKYGMSAVSGIVGGVVVMMLAYSFSSAVGLNLSERPIEYEILGDNGSMHVCDATDAQMKALEDFSRPTAFCVMRKALAVVGVSTETPGAAFQIIAPMMFLVIGLRLLAQGVAAAQVYFGGESAVARAEAEDAARKDATRASLRPGGQVHDDHSV